MVQQLIHPAPNGALDINLKLHVANKRQKRALGPRTRIPDHWSRIWRDSSPHLPDYDGWLWISILTTKYMLYVAIFSILTTKCMLYVATSTGKMQVQPGQ